MNKTKKLRSAVAVIISFLMSICIVATVIIGVARMTALSPSYAKRIVLNSGFGEKKMNELKTELVSYGNACNIGDDFFDGFFKKTLTKELIEKDAVKYYSLIYSELKPSVDTAHLEEPLKTALVEYAEKNGYAEDETLDEDINLIVGEMCEIYSGVLSVPSVSTIHSLISKAKSLCDVALLAAAGGLLLTAFMLLFMFKPKVYSVRYLIYAFSGAFLMLMAAPLYIRITNTIGKVNVVSKSLYSFIVSFGNGVLDSVIIGACVCAVITAVLSLVYIKLLKKAK